MTDPTSPAALLPVLAAREAWAVGLVVVFAVLRPVGRLGWAVAASLIVAGVGSIAALAAPAAGWTALEPGAWLALPWVVLAGLLVATAEGQPLRWEPRSGPSTAKALVAGAALLHVGTAWAHRGGALMDAGAGWLTDAGGVVGDSPGPLAPALVWLVHRPPLIESDLALVAVSLGALALLVLGVGRQAGRWGFRGTAWSTAAAAVWLPQGFLAHGPATGALLAAAALVWSSAYLGEVYAGRHLPDRIALASGALLGAAVGLALWPLLVVPLWLRRVAGRRTGWFAGGLGASLVASLLVLALSPVSLATTWRLGVVDAVRAANLPIWLVGVLVAVAVAAGVRGVPLSPTRQSAVTAALLILTIPWWPASWALTGPVLATPFVLLAAVAPDRPEDRWPPDAPLAVADDRVGVG